MKMFSQNALQELPPPPGVTGDSKSREVLRAWVANEGLLVSLDPLAFGGPATWGMLLVDIARHVARSFEQEGQNTFDGAMLKMRCLFDQEWDAPTDMGATHDLKNQ
jgi:Domain of unknown function (DUF5076)